MRWPALCVANTIIDIYRRSDKKYGVILNAMKLNYCVYFINGSYLAVKDDYLIDEVVVAGEYGPQIRSVYQHFAKYRNEEIPKLASRYTYVDSPVELDCIQTMWSYLESLSPGELATWAHEKGSPWDQERERMQGMPFLIGHEIPKHLIKQWFQRFLIGDS